MPQPQVLKQDDLQYIASGLIASFGVHLDPVSIAGRLHAEAS